MEWHEGSRRRLVDDFLNMCGFVNDKLDCLLDVFPNVGTLYYSIINDINKIKKIIRTIKLKSISKAKSIGIHASR